MIPLVCFRVTRFKCAPSIRKWFVPRVTRSFVIALAACGFANHVGATSLSDTFDGNTLDWCRWEDTSRQGTVSQGGELTLSPSGTDTFTRARVHSQARLIGDFDVQVDYRLGAGLEAPVAGAGQQLNVALGVYWDEARYIVFGRTRQAGGDGMFVYASLPELVPNNSVFAPEGAQAGTLRIARTGGQVRYYSRPSGSAIWIDLGAMNVPTTPVHVTLSAFNVNVARGFSGHFDNLVLNTGATDDIDYAQPAFFNKRDDFAIAAVVADYPVQRYWRGKWNAKDFFEYARESGFDWVKTSVTTRSTPELAATPPDRWGALPWQDAFWSSREYAAATLRQAAARGLRQEVQLFLSSESAGWGVQGTPKEWAGKSPDEIMPLLEQNVFDTVTYFKNQGFNVEKYAIGNEVDIGILDFLPLGRIPVPPGVDFVGDLAWLRANVWSIEAKLLNAAAAGVKRADPAAKIILHIGGLETTPGNVFAPAFFEAMRDFGVPFDYAALSHPYAYFPWKLDRYPAACWFKRVALTANRIQAATGKPVMMVESSYSAKIGAGVVAAPMPDFPFTPAGQAAWVREQLRFASNQLNIAGWHYFYPDMASDVISAGAAAVQLETGSLFESSTNPRPALAEFRVNLGAAAPAPNFEGLWWASPAASQSGWGINFAHQGDVIFATWFTYHTTGKAWWLSMTATKTAAGVYAGTLYQTRGPAFNAVPFGPAAVTATAVGTGTLTFSDVNNGSFAYSVNGIAQTKAITRQVFAALPTCVFGAQPDLTLATNYQDLWWAAPAGIESGWGVNFTHQGDIIFATWFTYDTDSGPLWLSATVNKTTPGGYTGTLYRTTGPAFNAVPFLPANVSLTSVGTLTLTFTNGNSATFAYTVNGVTQTKSIVRQVFRTPGTVCQ